MITLACTVVMIMQTPYGIVEQKFNENVELFQALVTAKNIVDHATSNMVIIIENKPVPYIVEIRCNPGKQT